MKKNKFDLAIDGEKGAAVSFDKRFYPELCNTFNSFPRHADIYSADLAGCKEVIIRKLKLQIDELKLFGDNIAKQFQQWFDSEVKKITYFSPCESILGALSEIQLEAFYYELLDYAYDYYKMISLNNLKR